MLLLVDNCEHVVDAAAVLIDDILSRCPGVTVLATSREALAVPDEVQVTVGPWKRHRRTRRPGEVLSYPAAQLFAERARAVRPGLLFGADNLTAIGAICRVPRRHPARARARRRPGVDAVAGRGLRTAREPVHAAHLRRPHRRGPAADAARHRRLELRPAVRDRATGVRPALGLPGRLDADVGRGRRRRRGARGPARSSTPSAGSSNSPWSSSNPARPPGTGCWRRCVSTPPNSSAASGEAETWRAATPRTSGSMASSTPRLRCAGTSSAQTLRLLRDEQPNIRAALAWLSGPDGDRDAALTMAGSLGMFWHLGRHLEGREVLARLLAARTTGHRRRGRSALQAVSIVERPRGCLVHPSPRCAETAAESLALFEQLGDAWPAPPCPGSCSRSKGVTGADPERSEALLREAEDQFRPTRRWTDADVGARGHRVRPDGDRDQDRRRRHRHPRSAAPPPPRSGSSTTPGDCPRSCTTSDGGCGSSAATTKAPGSWRRRSTSPRAPGCGTPPSGRSPTWRSTKVHLGDDETARRPVRRSSRRVPRGRRRRRGGARRVRVRPSRPGRRGLGPKPGGPVRPRRSGFIELGTPVPEGVALAGLGRCDEADGDLDTARAGYERAWRWGVGSGSPGWSPPRSRASPGWRPSAAVTMPASSWRRRPTSAGAGPVPRHRTSGAISNGPAYSPTDLGGPEAPRSPARGNGAGLPGHSSGRLRVPIQTRQAVARPEGAGRTGCRGVPHGRVRSRPAGRPGAGPCRCRRRPRRW